jgi:hypothetical protein
MYLYTNDMDLLRSTNNVCKVSYTTIHHFLKKVHVLKGMTPNSTNINKTNNNLLLLPFSL